MGALIFDTAIQQMQSKIEHTPETQNWKRCKDLENLHKVIRITVLSRCEFYMYEVNALSPSSCSCQSFQFLLSKAGSCEQLFPEEPIPDTFNSSSSSFCFHCGVPQSWLASATWAPKIPLSRQNDPTVTLSHNGWPDPSWTLTHPNGAGSSSLAEPNSTLGYLSTPSALLKLSDEVGLFSPSWKSSWPSWKKKISTFLLFSDPREQSGLSCPLLLFSESRAKASE